jgi:hypothetical protein
LISTALVCLAVSRALIFGQIAQVSHEMGVSESLMTYIVSHEAKLTPTGDFLPCGDGDGHLTDPLGAPHRSRGIVQINEYFHPEINDMSAYNVRFSLEYLASKLREGKCSWWTTCRAYMKDFPSGAS